MHTYGKALRDLLRIRAGDIPRVPDVVIYPGDEAEVQLIVDRAVAADAVIIPYGGGSNISGSLHAPEDETRPVISLDLGRMNQVIDIDQESGLAHAFRPAHRARTWRNSWRARMGSRTLPRQLHSQHARRLGRHPVLRHAVGQVRRHLRHRTRHASRHARQGAASSAAAPHLDGPERPRDGAWL